MFVRDKPHMAHMIRKSTSASAGPTPHPTAAPTAYASVPPCQSLASSMQASVAARLRGLSFAGRLHYLLSHGIYDLSLERIIRWQPGGHSFAVHSQEEFEMQGLAHMLGTPGYSSFRAQLTIHGFQRVRSDGPDVEAYYHADFVREQPQLCHLIRSRNPGHLQSAMRRHTSSKSPTASPMHRLVSPMSDVSVKASRRPIPDSLFLDSRAGPRRMGGHHKGNFDPFRNHVDLTQAEPEQPQEKPRKQQQKDLKPRKRPRVGHMMPQNYFPFKLHSLLTLSEKFGLQHLMTWSSHGRSFMVNDKDLFCDAVLPLFRHGEFASFRAQLKAYGFVRISRSGPDKGAYYHTCFLRGKPELCATITRRPKNVNGTTRGRPKGRQYVEPDFYKLKFLPDLDIEEVDPPPGTIKDILEAALTQITPPAVVTQEVHLPNGALGDMKLVVEKKPPRAPTKQELFFQKAKNHDVRTTLPVKLHKLLNDAHEHDFDRVVAWNDSGRSFSILDEHAFHELLVVRWLDLPSLKQFQDELELYGFKRRATGACQGAYYHEMFHKALPHLCRCIKKETPTKPGVTTVAATNQDSITTELTATPAASGSSTEISVSSSTTGSRTSSPELEAAMALSVMDSPQNKTQNGGGASMLNVLIHTAEDEKHGLPVPPLLKTVSTSTASDNNNSSSSSNEKAVASTSPTTVTIPSVVTPTKADDSSSSSSHSTAKPTYQDPPGRYD